MYKEKVCSYKVELFVSNKLFKKIVCLNMVEGTKVNCSSAGFTGGDFTKALIHLFF